MVQDRIYNSTLPVNPTMTQTNGETWFSLAMALKPAAAGTPAPSGMQIYWAHHIVVQAGSPGTYNLQVPVKGNLLVDMFSGGNNDCISSITSTPSNTISNPNGCVVAGTNANFVNGQYIASPSLTNGGLVLEIVQPGTPADYNHVIYDVKNAASNPLDVATNNTGYQTGTGDWDSITITPNNADGIIFAHVPVDFNTVISTTTPGALLQNGYLSTNSTGNTPYDENNGWATYKNNSGSSVTFGWRVMPGLGSNVGNWASEALAFKAH
jgi:hypothetical protein